MGQIGDRFPLLGQQKPETFGKEIERNTDIGDLIGSGRRHPPIEVPAPQRQRRLRQLVHRSHHGSTQSIGCHNRHQHQKYTEPGKHPPRHPDTLDQVGIGHESSHHDIHLLIRAVGGVERDQNLGAALGERRERSSFRKGNIDVVGLKHGRPDLLAVGKEDGDGVGAGAEHLEHRLCRRHRYLPPFGAGRVDD